jgi:hypothetical protein
VGHPTHEELEQARFLLDMLRRGGVEVRPLPDGQNEYLFRRSGAFWPPSDELKATFAAQRTAVRRVLISEGALA